MSARERQVLEFLSRGLSNAQIGLELDLAAKTVQHLRTGAAGTPIANTTKYTQNPGRSGGNGGAAGVSGNGSSGPSFAIAHVGMLGDWTRARRALADAAKKLETGKSRVKGKQLARTFLLAPVLYPGAIFCAGANYRDHAEEMVGVHVREEDVLEGERHPEPHHLPLGPFAAVEHQRLAFAHEGDRWNIALDRRTRRRRAEEPEGERHAGGI